MEKTQEQMQEEMDELLRKVEEEIGVGKIAELDSFKALATAMEKIQQRKAREQPRQMMDANDVAEALGVSKSSAYKYIRQLNNELSKAGYLTVRGKISRVYLEERTYGVTFDE